jgi:membrane-bound lytic murein transglycosylase MltF
MPRQVPPAHDGPVNRTLFTFASSNAGSAKTASLRKEATAAAPDPNVWLNNVELIAARRIGRETVQHVSNIYDYYIAYGWWRRNGKRGSRPKPPSSPQ